MERQIGTLRKFARTVSFYGATRPTTAGEFPSVGARGCFESHLHVLREACIDGVKSVLVVEDDFDFHLGDRVADVIECLADKDWDFFYGAHLLPHSAERPIAPVAADQPIITASFVGFRGRAMPKIVEFLEEMLKRPAGSPDYGPMHVDGAYSVFRMLHPEFRTVAAFPQLGEQRSSRSDITPKLLDRLPITRQLAAALRRLVRYSWGEWR